MPVDLPPARKLAKTVSFISVSRKEAARQVSFALMLLALCIAAAIIAAAMHLLP